MINEYCYGFVILEVLLPVRKKDVHKLLMAP